MKKFSRIGLVLVLAAIFLVSGAVGVSAAPDVNAAAAVVMDADTGAFYFEKNAKQMRVPASMTKLMTTYVVFEELKAGNISLDTVVTVTSHGAAVAANGAYSNVPLYRGEQYTVDTMIKLMLIPSACGACSTMADFISGSESAFAARMNEEAAEIGMTSAFTTSHGAVNDYTTNAHSMALLVKTFVQKHPEILNYTSLKSYTFKGTTYKNTNKFLGSDYYAGVDGMKTGTSSVAGGCISVTAEKNGRRIIVVVMGSSSRYDDARKLLDYGFSCVTAADASLQGTTIRLESKRSGIRIGTDFAVQALLSNVAANYTASGGWLVNGTEVSRFDRQDITNGAQVLSSFNLDAYAGNDVTIGFYLNLPDGTKKTVERVFSFSDEEPCAFRDVEGHWAEAYISSMKEAGVLTGYPDGTFGSERSISRGEFITAFVRMLEVCGQITVAENAVSGFEDCNGHWAEPYISAAKEAGIAAGVSETKFAPDQTITRQEITAFIARALAYSPSGTASGFTDDGAIASWAKPSVIACVETGILSGYPDGSFRPDGKATRAEIATILARVFEQIAVDEGEENDDRSDEEAGEGNGDETDTEAAA